MKKMFNLMYEAAKEQNDFHHLCLSETELMLSVSGIMFDFCSNANILTKDLAQFYNECSTLGTERCMEFIKYLDSYLDRDVSEMYRVCDSCGEVMFDGFLNEGDYYCKSCFQKKLDSKEIQELNDTARNELMALGLRDINEETYYVCVDGDCIYDAGFYWTEWE